MKMKWFRYFVQSQCLHVLCFLKKETIFSPNTDSKVNGEVNPVENIRNLNINQVYKSLVSFDITKLTASTYFGKG